MPRLFYPLALVVVIACFVSGCASEPKPYDEQFVTERDKDGKPTGWVIKPSRQQTQRAESKDFMPRKAGQ